MQMVKRVLLILLIAWGAVILLAPKKELYYLLERQLQKQGIILAQEKLTETPLGLKVEEAKLYLEGVEFGKIDRISLWTLLVYTQVDVKSFQPASRVRKLLNLELSRARIRYALWHPSRMKVEAEGSFGKTEGMIDLRKRTILLRWTKTGNLQGLKSYLKKDSKGWYYERKF